MQSSAILMTTTSTFENREAEAYLGVMSSTAVLGVNFMRDFFARFRDIFGGRTKSYELELEKARDAAFGELADQARAVGADAVVGIAVDYEMLGEKNGMLMVSVTGTAVRLK